MTRPTVDEIMSRIIRGRQLLLSTMIDPERKSIQIVVGVDVWTTLMTEARRIAWAHNVVIFDLGVLRVFGIETIRDTCLDVDHIRFRSEVSV